MLRNILTALGFRPKADGSITQKALIFDEDTKYGRNDATARQDSSTRDNSEYEKKVLKSAETKTRGRKSIKTVSNEKSKANGKGKTSKDAKGLGSTGSTATRGRGRPKGSRNRVQSVD